MADDMTSEAGELSAGVFAAWMDEIREAIDGTSGSDVPCGNCTACCSSSQFVHIEPDETDALAHIPKQLVFPAPMLPKGHVLMGYDEHGCCPMLIDGQCSIYAHRPRTCRTYDCRVFPATGLQLSPDDDKPLIARQTVRWRFDLPTANDRRLQAAVRAAAEFLTTDDDAVAIAGRGRPSTTQLAVLAVELHELFLDGVSPGPGAVRVELARRRRTR